MPYLAHLKESMPIACLDNWVGNQVREKYSAYGHYARPKEDVVNIGLGCNN